MISPHINDTEVCIYINDSIELQEQKNLRGIEKYPEQKDFFLQRLYWLYLYNLKQPEKALSCIKEAIASVSIKENLGEYYHCLSRVYQSEENKQLELAIEAMVKSVVHDPLNPEGVLELASLYMENKDYKNAIAVFRNVLLSPDDYGIVAEEEYYDAVLALSEGEEGVESTDVIYKCLLEAASTDDERAAVHEMLSAFYEVAEDFKGAIDHAKTALKLSPDRFSSAIRLGKCYLKYKQYPAAIKAYRKITGMKDFAANAPNRNWHWRYYYESLALLYVIMENWDEALDCYEKMLPLYDSPKESYDALEQLAGINYTQKRYKACLPYLNRIIELWPKQYARAYTSMAGYYSEEEKDMENALNYLRLAAEANYQSDTFLLGNDRHLGCLICLWIGNLYADEFKDEEQAIDWYERILRAPELNREEVSPDLKELGAKACDRLYKIYTNRGNEKKANEYKDRRSGLQVMLELFSPEWRPDPPKNLSKRLKTPKDKESTLLQLAYHYTKLPEDWSERETALKPVKEAFEKDLLENPAYKSFFEKYTPESVRDFCKQYAEHKKGLASGWEYYIDEPPKVVGWRKSAEKMLELILHKKLFNKQLLWRAEKISIPVINVGYDFEWWDDNLQACPFIEEITPAEIDLMKAFLMNDDFSDSTEWFLCSWQDYARLMEQDEEDNKRFMPRWYEFYDGRMGTGAYLLLPDIRGEKEKEYTNIYTEWLRKNPPPPPPPAEPYVPVPQPIFTYDGSKYTEFMELFENDYLCHLHQGWLVEQHQKPDEHYSNSAIFDAIQQLEGAEEPVYMEGGLVWHEAIIRCAQRFKNSKVVELLDETYANYLTKRELNLNNQLKNPAGKESHSKLIKDSILKARELKGEPKDFNY
jgi:tetratricopeptide (TPR) repeat protein